jgi:hypothetical protein
MSIADAIESAVAAAAQRALRCRADTLRRKAAGQISVVDGEPPIVIVASEVVPALRTAKMLDAIADEIGGRR